METIITTICLVSAVATIALILLQKGKGVNMGTAFNTGTPSAASNSSESDTRLNKLTTASAVLFFGCSIVLTNISMSSPTIQEESPASVQAPAERSEFDIPQ
ncbi:preprotein translocase subunit SecG [Vibrio sp. 99-70-13A1]|uniref:preprotein translocase subunit SecG n=1 Tax=Vibrio sp. 99-70-13A1 TaxID=2607601 RepID=UPI001493435F|nr:preprotein translocase subunit SecG [Vibrio sp. 99-70-13A1]NOH96021.1 preprotein translocase subunit SecG [Vibrio sp. 99-70-13A1]